MTETGMKWGKVREPSAILSWREDVKAAKELLYSKQVIKQLEYESDPHKRQRILHDARHRM